MIKVKSKVKLNLGQIKQLDRAAVMALVQTAESLHKEIVQAQGVKISKIQGLENDIAQSLKALGIRPGQGDAGSRYAVRPSSVLPSGVPVPYRLLDR